jgi:hypothetical protein
VPDAAAVLAFLKQASIEPAFDAAFVRRVLNVSAAEAKQIVATLEAAGYIERAGHRWRTTEAGDVASGAKAPRLRRAGVEKALAGLIERIAATPRVKRAVIFGQYLSDHDPIQDADVGVDIEGAGRDERALMAKLKARSSALNLHPFSTWMEQIQHKQIWPRT